MRFSSLFATLVLAPLAVLAQNPVSYPTAGTVLKAGDMATIKWQPTTPGAVTLVLRSGDANDLKEGTPIATNVNNNGVYEWHVASSITQGATYTIEIVDSTATTVTNYSPMFSIMSSVTVASKTMTFTVTPLSSSASTMSNTASSTTGSASTTMSTSTTSSPTALVTFVDTGAAGMAFGGVHGRGIEGALAAFVVGIVGWVV